MQLIGAYWHVYTLVIHADLYADICTLIQKHQLKTGSGNLAIIIHNITCHAVKNLNMFMFLI